MAKTLAKKPPKDVIDGYRLVRPGKGLPTLSKVMVPNTFFRVDKKTGEVRSLVTVMPGDLLVAWDVCGQCHYYFSTCKCNLGIHVCRSVEYIYDHRRASEAGEEWGMGHRDYNGSIIAAARKRQQRSTGLSSPLRSLTAGEPGKSLRKPSAPSGNDTTTVPRKKLLKKKSGNEVIKPLAKEATDMGALNTAADSMATDLEKELLSKISNSSPRPKKLLKRRK